MIESEVKIYDSKINLHSMDAENINPPVNLTFETVEVTSRFEEVRSERVVTYTRRRKFKRVKSAGIF